MPLVAGMALASAGAITSANRMGVSSGTRTSRGVLALSEARRRARVANAVSSEGRLASTATPERVRGGLVVRVVTVMLRSVGECWWADALGGEAGAGELEVDVVERGRSGGERAHRHRGSLDRVHGLTGRAVVQRDRERRAGGEGVLARRANGAQRPQRGLGIVGDPQLENLPTQSAQQ